MANRLAFQTQLASIMEVLANAAVAEICKLVDDDYAVVSLQMSQCQRENKALKRKLHLLELKMARGYAERRLRESAQNNNRPRVQINANDRLRGSSSSTDGVFQRQMDMGLWPGGAATGEATSEPVHSDTIRDKSPDVELVEPEPRLVKEEKMEESMPQDEEIEDDVPLIGEDGVVECGSRGGGGRRPSLQQQETQSASCQTQASAHLPQPQANRSRHPGSGSSGSTSSNNNRGVEAAAVQKEEEPDVVLVKVEEAEPVTETQSQTGLSIQEGLVESSTDDYRGVMPLDETTQNSTHQLLDLQESGQGFSESPAPESIPLITEEPCSIVSVQLRVPDTNTPANPNLHQQQLRSNTGNALSSEYSLFELETFFTRWAPDNDSVSPARGPSCSFSTDDSAKCEQDGIIVETEPQPHLVLQPPQGSTSSIVRMTGGESSESFSSQSGRPRVHSQPTVSQGTSAPLQLQAPSSQPPWSRTVAMMRTAQTQSLLQQQRRYGNRISQQQHGIQSPQNKLSTTTAGVSNTNSVDITSISSISSTCRTMGSTVVPQLSLAVRGTTTAVAAGRRWPTSLLAHQNKNQAANVVPVERRRKSYLCRACGKAFSGLSNLEAHQRVHTGEKPFRCTTCGKQFSEAGNLKKHQRVHTGEKPYSCDHCGKHFAWICNLKTHQQSAMGCGLLARGPNQ